MGKILVIKGADFSAVAVEKVEPITGKIVISVLSADSTMGSASGGGRYDEGQQITISATPNSGYKFVQWSDGNTEATRTIIVGSTSATYTAMFAERPTNVLEGLNYTPDTYWKLGTDTEPTSFKTWNAFDEVDISHMAGKRVKVRLGSLDKAIDTPRNDYCYIKTSDGTWSLLGTSGAVGTEGDIKYRTRVLPSNVVSLKAGFCYSGNSAVEPVFFKL